jgi:methionyl-tRNA formyltransferase
VARDRVQGRATLRETARKARVPYMLLTKESRDLLPGFVARAAPDVICVASLSHLLAPEVLEVPRHGVINLHPSMLPRYHGPFPWFWQYHDFQLDIGITVHVLDAGQDTGPIIGQEPVRLGLGLDVADALDQVAPVGARLMAKAVRGLEDGSAEPRAQPTHSFPTARIVERHERFIDWERWPIERVWHFMRGTYPWVDPVDYDDSLPRPVKVGEMKRGTPGAPPGQLGVDEEGPFVAHPEGRIELIRG